MSQRLTGRNLAAVGITIIVCLTVLGVAAMHYGIDGAIFAAVVAAIVATGAGLGGYALPRG